jgi:hypothetical protein
MLPRPNGRAPATTQAYQRVVKTLRNHVSRMQAVGDLPLEADDNLLMALAWLELQPWIAPATSRQYKAALCDHMRQHPGADDDEVMRLIDPDLDATVLEREERLAEQRKLNLTGRRGAQQRATHLSAEDWRCLMEALYQSTSLYGRVAALWLAATRLVGLRPCEWASARRVGFALVVCTAKSTQGRAHGPTRSLNLSGLSPMEVKIIDRCLAEMDGQQGPCYRQLYSRVRDLLADVGRRCLSPRSRYPSLYTARHMFASAAKSTFTKVEVAALLGHGNVDSAALHYAAARYARGGRPLEVRASPGDIDAVLRRQQAGWQPPIQPRSGGEEGPAGIQP